MPDDLDPVAAEEARRSAVATNAQGEYGDRPAVLPPWEEVGQHVRSAFPDLDPSAVEQRYGQARLLSQARERHRRDEEGTGERIARHSIPFYSAVRNTADEVAYGRAQQRLQAGRPEDDDYDLIAAHEHRQQQEAQAPIGEAVATGLMGIPAILGEAYVGGHLARGVGAGVSRVLGRAAPVAAEAAAPVLPSILQAAPAATPMTTGGIARAAGQVVGGAAQRLPFMPTFYAQHWAQDNIRHGRDPMDIRGLPPAMAYGTLQLSVLGSLSRFANQIPGTSLSNYLHRASVRAGVGVSEQAAVDVLAGATGLNAGYGLVGDILSGRSEDALRHAAVQAAVFGAFSAIHEYQQPRTPVMDSFARAVRAGANEGRPRAEVAAEVDGVRQTAAEMFQAGHSRAEIRAAMENMEPGPLRNYGMALADAVPERAVTRPTPSTAEAPTPETPPPPEAPLVARARQEARADLQRRGYSAQEAERLLERSIGPLEGMNRQQALAALAERYGQRAGRPNPAHEFARAYAETLPDEPTQAQPAAQPPPESQPPQPAAPQPAAPAAPAPRPAEIEQVPIQQPAAPAATPPVPRPAPVVEHPAQRAARLVSEAQARHTAAETAYEKAKKVRKGKDDPRTQEQFDADRTASIEVARKAAEEAQHVADEARRNLAEVARAGRPLDPQQQTAEDIKKGMEGMGEGFKEGVRQKVEEYARRIHSGEKPESVLSGLKEGGAMRQAVEARLAELRAQPPAEGVPTTGGGKPAEGVEWTRSRPRQTNLRETPDNRVEFNGRDGRVFEIEHAEQQNADGKPFVHVRVTHGGEKAAEMFFWRQPDGSYSGAGLIVEPKFRGKNGVGEAMYDYMSTLGARIVPSETQTPQGKAFWHRHLTEVQEARAAQHPPVTETPTPSQPPESPPRPPEPPRAPEPAQTAPEAAALTPEADTAVQRLVGRMRGGQNIAPEEVFDAVDFKNPREQRILEDIWQGRTYDEIGAEHGVSRQRIGQIKNEMQRRLGLTDADWNTMSDHMMARGQADRIAAFIERGGHPGREVTDRLNPEEVREAASRRAKRLEEADREYARLQGEMQKLVDKYLKESEKGISPEQEQSYVERISELERQIRAATAREESQHPGEEGTPQGVRGQPAGRGTSEPPPVRREGTEVPAGRPPAEVPPESPRVPPVQPARPTPEPGGAGRSAEADRIARTLANPQRGQAGRDELASWLSEVAKTPEMTELNLAKPREAIRKFESRENDDPANDEIIGTNPMSYLGNLARALHMDPTPETTRRQIINHFRSMIAAVESVRATVERGKARGNVLTPPPGFTAKEVEAMRKAVRKAHQGDSLDETFRGALFARPEAQAYARAYAESLGPSPALKAEAERLMAENRTVVESHNAMLTRARAALAPFGGHERLLRDRARGKLDASDINGLDEVAEDLATSDRFGRLFNAREHPGDQLVEMLQRAAETGGRRPLLGREEALEQARIEHEERTHANAALRAANLAPLTPEDIAAARAEFDQQMARSEGDEAPGVPAAGATPAEGQRAAGEPAPRESTPVSDVEYDPTLFGPGGGGTPGSGRGSARGERVGPFEMNETVRGWLRGEAGLYTERNVQGGQYRPEPRVIERSKMASANAPLLFHELAHHISVTGRLALDPARLPPDVANGLKALDYDPQRADPNTAMQEGFAEWVRRRTTGDLGNLTPEQQAAATYLEGMMRLRPQWLKRLNQLREMWSKYAAGTPGEQFGALISTTGRPAAAQTTPGERIETYLDRTREAAQENLLKDTMPAERAERAAERAGGRFEPGEKLSEVIATTRFRNTPTAHEFENGGVFYWGPDGKEVRLSGPLRAALEGITPEEAVPTGPFERYMRALHVLHSLGEGTSTYSREQVSGAREVLAERTGPNADRAQTLRFERAAQAYRDINNATLDAMVGAGRITAERAAYLKEKHPFYISEQHITEPDFRSVPSYGSPRKGESPRSAAFLKERTGSGEQWVNYLDAIRDRYRFLASVLTDQAKFNALLRLGEMPNTGHWLNAGERVKPGAEPDTAVPVGWPKDGSKPSLTGYVEGEPVTVRINDRAFYELVTGTQGESGTMGPFFRTLGNVAQATRIPQLTRTGATLFSPLWHIRNFFRDPVLYVQRTIANKNPFQNLGDLATWAGKSFNFYWRALRAGGADKVEVRQESDNYFKLFERMAGREFEWGALSGQETFASRAMTGWRGLLQRVSDVLTGMEKGTRVLEMRNVLDTLGWTSERIAREMQNPDVRNPIPFGVQVAALDVASQITHNVHQQGVWIRQLNRAWPFLGAHIAGVYKDISTFAKQPGKAAAGLAILATVKALEFVLNKDDKEYAEIPPYLRDGFNFRTPLGWLHFPAPRGIDAPITGLIGETLRATADANPRFRDLLVHSFEQLAPHGGPEPFNIAAHVMANRSWSGREIIPEREAAGMNMAERLIDPRGLQYMAGQATGGVLTRNPADPASWNPFRMDQHPHQSVTDYFDHMHAVEVARMASAERRAGRAFPREREYAILHSVYPQMVQLAQAIAGRQRSGSRVIQGEAPADQRIGELRARQVQIARRALAALAR